MLRNRVIPLLLISDGGLVKTTGFNHPRYLGDPLNAIRIFNDKEVDEIAVLDITATPRGRGPDLALIRELAEECFMPLTYGGGIRTPDDAERVFRLGVEKVLVRSGAARDPGLVPSIAQRTGSQSVAVSVDIESGRLRGRRVHCPGTPWHRRSDWRGLLGELAAGGAGEIMIQSVNRDGTRRGLDLELVSQAATVVNVPVIAAGGVGELSDIRDGVRAGASAIAAGSLFVFHGPHNAVLISYPDYSQLEELLSQESG